MSSPTATAPPDDVLRADRALVEAVLAGAPGAFERLVREYQGLCWHVIDRMVRQPEDTRELCQEAFLRVHQALHQYRGESALKSWIAQVAYSVAKRHLEKKRIPIVEAADDDGPSLAETVGDGFDLETAASDEDAPRLLLAGPASQQAFLTAALATWAADGAIIVVTGDGSDGAALERIAEQEGASARA